MGILTRIMDSVVYWKESSDGVLEGQNCHRLRNINFDTLNSFFSYIPSRHGPERFILNV